MSGITLDYSYLLEYMKEDEIANMVLPVKCAHQMLSDGSGAGAGYTGWLRLPAEYDRDEFTRIKEAAAKIRSDSDALIVVGIGGSYLGARAVIESLGHTFANLLPASRRKDPIILYAGNNISASYMSDLLDLIREMDISLNVISKSGTTTEPAIAFRILKELMEAKYGVVEAASRIYITTDAAKGSLRKICSLSGYCNFTIPSNIGGRYSVLTACGLLPIAVSGADISKLMEGAAFAMEAFCDPDPYENVCYLYAALRNILYRKSRFVEIMADFEPRLHFFVEWWKQLFGESEGKEGKGIFPAGVDFTTDLHSMGQYIQDGLKMAFETVIDVRGTQREVKISGISGDNDGFGFLAGKGMSLVNRKAMEGTLIAHSDGGTPAVIIGIEAIDEFNIGSLIYYFQKACAISGYILGVNPFNQPGVEDYKRNMFALLGKPGYEEQLAKIMAKLALKAGIDAKS